MKLKFIHIGHHKCGSTFIQKAVIPAVHSLRQLDFDQYGVAVNDAELAYLARCDDLYFDLEEFKKPFLASLPQGMNCLSWEGFVGHGQREAMTGSGIAHNARRLKALFGDTKILFCIRNQASFLRSLYKDDTKYGSICSFRKWIELKHSFTQLNWCKYAPVIELYQQMYGEQNVKVMLFENMFSHQAFQEVFDSFGIDSRGLEDVDFSKRANEGMCNVSFHFMRVINRLFGSKANYGDGSIYRLARYKCFPLLNQLFADKDLGRIDLNYDGFDSLIHNLYHEDNARVAELTGLDLASHGYV